MVRLWSAILLLKGVKQRSFTISRSKTLPLATDSTQEIYEVVRALFQALKINGARLRLVAVSLENLQEGAHEQLLLGAREKGWRDADTAIDKARARFGSSSVRPGRLIRRQID